MLNKNISTPPLKKGGKILNSIKIPYGNDFLLLKINKGNSVDHILPNDKGYITNKSQKMLIENTLNMYIGRGEDNLFKNRHSVAIAVNDQTRPIPNTIILPPILKKIESNGMKTENITFFIATGTHKGLSKSEMQKILPHKIYDRYRIKVHDCDEKRNLVFLGNSTSGTPIYINKDFYFHETKIVVGHIEPHHFMGFSGGVKSAAIGLGGRKTIEKNHSLIIDPKAKMGIFHENPMRKDVEEIGKIIGVDAALNVVLNSKKQIVNAFFGAPYQVMVNGIDISAENCQVEYNGKYDLVITSPGGYPKDINFYQSQKAITHACSFLKKNGVVILIAECRDGTGSGSFENFLLEKHTWREVINEFENQQFKIGPHKAYLLAQQLKDHPIILISEMKPELVRNLLLTPAKSLSDALMKSITYLPAKPRIAILPYATHVLKGKSYR